MSTLREFLEEKVKEEVALQLSLQSKRESWSKSAQIMRVAQEILDEVKPGEVVRTVEINTWTAAPKPAPEPVAKPKKTVYTITYFDHGLGCDHPRTWPTIGVEPNTFDTLEEAAEVLSSISLSTIKGNFRFILQSEVDA